MVEDAKPDTNQKSQKGRAGRSRGQKDLVLTTMAPRTCRHHVHHAHHRSQETQLLKDADERGISEGSWNEGCFVHLAALLAEKNAYSWPQRQ